MGWSLACPDWETRIQAGRSLIPELPLDREQFTRAINIFNKLRLPDVEGQPTFGEAGADWFREIIGTLFGSIDAATGQRFIRELFCLVPKKNNKTTGGAGLMVTALLLNRRPRAEFILTGPTHEVSELAFSQASGMIEADRTGFLQKRMHIQEHLKTITDRRTKAKLKIKTFDASVVTGPKPAGVLIDELHQIAKIKDAGKIIGQLRGGMVSQPEAFLAFITTQSDDPPAGAFRAELMKARAIRDGRLTGVPMLPILYEFPKQFLKSGALGQSHPWEDNSLWWMVTPNRDKSVSIERLISDFEGAKSSGEEEIRRWASQHLNIEIGLSLRSDRWSGADYWEPRADPSLTLEALLQRSESVTIGIDGGGMDDLLAIAVLGRESSRKWLLWTHSWAHTSVLERRKSEVPKLRDFEREGDLTIVADLGQDVTEIADIVEQVSESGLLPRKNAIGVDPVGIGQIIDELSLRGISTDQVVGVTQGWKMSGAIKTTERALAAGELTHAGQQIMSWAVGNARVEPKGNAILITKQASGTAKIDPLMAAFDAVALMEKNPDGAQSVYEQHGIRFF